MTRTSWKAVYKDGTFLKQYGSDGSERKYTDIKRDLLAQFHIIHDDKTLVVIHLNGNKRLIYRRRVAQHYAIGPQGKTGQEVVIIVGWQENHRGVNVQMLCFIFEDGHVEVVDRFYPKHPWFYPVIFRPEEKTSPKQNRGPQYA